MKESKCKCVRLGDYIVELDNRNEDLLYGEDSVRGVSNTKLIQKTKANLSGRNLTPFHVVSKDEFVFNRRTTRNGERLGLGYNDSDETLIFTEDYVHFKVKDANILHPCYLYLLFKRDEFDRYVRYNSWGSATEFFNWEDMQRVQIPLPSIEEQQKVVNAWKALREIKEQNEAIAAPLMQVCQSYIQELKHKYQSVEIGPFMERITERNTDNLIKEVRGMSTEKEFRIPNSRVDFDKLSNYKVIKKNEFVFVPTTDTWRCLAICLSREEVPFVVSPIYEAFRIDTKIIEPEYLHLFCKRKELDRYARFHSWGSARENFTYEDMQRVRIPLPPIDVQQSIVNLYNCANEAKKIAEEADKKSREICPALIQYVINNNNK